MRSRFRFGLALGLAAVLGGWLIYTSLGGSLETYASPTQLSSAAPNETLRLNGKVGPGAPKDAAAQAQTAAGLQFTVVDKDDPESRVLVSYHGQVPPAFKVGRELVVTGTYEGSVFQAKRDSMVTLCPSKFTDQPQAEHPEGQ